MDEPDSTRQYKRYRSAAWHACRTGIAAAPLVAAACVPHVAHGPRVEPGTRFFIDTGIIHTRELQDESFSFIPSLYAGAAHGWLFADSASAFSLGFQLPLYLLPVVLSASGGDTFLATSYLDLYVQPRRSVAGRADFGIGALASTGLLMPYIQFGSGADGGFSTTQAIATTHGPLAGALYWLPSIARRHESRDGRRVVHFYLNGGIGLDEPGDEWFVGLGVMIEFRR